jgi:lipopolysaccharide exporter
MDLRAKATRGMAWTSLSAAGMSILQVVQLAILARFLSPDDFGLMAMTAIVLALGSALADGGITSAVIHFREISHRQLSSLYWLNLLASLAVFAVMLLGADAFASLFDESRLPPVIRAMAILFLVVPWGHLFLTLMEKELRFARIAKIQLATATVGTTLACSAAVLGAGVYALVLGALVSAGLSTIVLTLLGWREWRPGLHFALVEILPFIRFGAFQLGERTLNILHRQADKLLLGVLLGAGALGRYAVVAQLADRPIQTINPILTRVAFPVFAELQADDNRLRRGYLEVIAAISLIQAPIFLGLIATADRFIPALLGPGWLDTVAAFRILCVLGLLRGLGNPVGSLLLAKGKADWGFYLNLAALVIYGLAVALGTMGGIEGVALALVLANVCVFFPLGFVIRRKLVGMGIYEYFATFMPSLITAIAMAGAVYWAGRYIAVGSSLIELTILAAGGALLYVTAVILLNLPAWRAILQGIKVVFSR